MEVIILAGGLGTRLRPVVSEVPKCMAPVDGKPFLWYLLSYLKRFQVSRVILSVGYLKDVVTGWIADYSSEFPFSFDFAVEEEPLGTGGGIKLALSRATTDDVVVLNGDTFFNVDLDRFFRQHSQGKESVSLALKPMTKFERYGNVLVEGWNEGKTGGRISEFKEKAYCEDGLINGGIYVIDRKALDLSSLGRKFSFETQVLEKEAAEGHVQGFVHDDYFIDIGIPSDYERSQKELSELTRVQETVLQVDLALEEGNVFKKEVNRGGWTLLLDRDGVINRQIVGDYVRTWEQFVFLPGIKEALRHWAGQFDQIVLISNQRGVGKGLMTQETLDSIHEKMAHEIEKAGGRIDAIYTCPALDEDNPMRKPHIGMFDLARKENPSIDPSRTIMVGDSDSDMAFAANCGVIGIKM